MYREARPSAPLAAWVDCYWTRSMDDGVESSVLPDGCADVIFDVDHASGFVVGTMTSPLIVPANTSPQLFGVRFRPGRATLGIGVPLREITDARAALRDVRSIGAGFAERVAAAPTFAARIALVEDMLSRGLRAVTPDVTVDAAIALIERSVCDIESVAGAIGVSRQHLARKFAISVGVSPKTFARVARFRRVLRAASADVDWAALALHAGYFDQSHLIADFRQFAGMSPVPFFLSRAATPA